jgi:hypothetical protein
MNQICELEEERTNTVCNVSKTDVLCKAEDIGLDSFLICLIQHPKECRFSLCFGDVYFCKNPHRVSISKEYKK